MIVLRSFLFADECFFGASLILGVAWLATRGRPAAFRHLIWSGAFAAMLVLPFVAAIVPSQMVFPVMQAAPMSVVVAGPAAAVVPPPSGLDIADVIIGLCLVWFAGTLAVLLRAAVGGAGLMYLKLRSVSHIPDGIDGAPFRDVRWQLRLRTAPGEQGPITWGVFKPVVLLPKSSVRWPRAQLQAVLLHEVAHIRRRDSLARLIAVIACALYWPNPFVWAAATRMRRDAEIAADDAVLTSGVRATDYAEQLVGLARQFAGHQPSFVGVSLSMAEPSTLKARVQSVLSPAALRAGVTKMDVLKIAALGVALTSVLALSRPSFAETPEPAVVKQALPEPTPVAAPVSDPAPAAVPEAPEKKDCHCKKPHTMADAVPPAPPALPENVDEPPVPPVSPVPPGRYSFHKLTAEERAEIRRNARQAAEETRRAAAEGRRAAAEGRRAAMEARKALEDAHIDQAVAEALKTTQLAIKDAHIAEKVRQALADAHIEEKVAEAMQRAQIEIKRAHIERMKVHQGDVDVDVDVDTEK